MIEGVVYSKKPEEDTRSHPSWSVQEVCSQMFEPLDQNLVKCFRRSDEHWTLWAPQFLCIFCLIDDDQLECEAFCPVRVEEGSRDTWVAWRPDSRRLFSVRHPSRCIVVPAARGPAGMLGWWCWWWSRRRRRRRGESILRGLTACCTCPPPVSTSLTPPRNKLREENLLKLVFSTNLQTELWRLFTGSSLNQTAHMFRGELRSSLTWSPASLQLILKEQFTSEWMPTPHGMEVKWWHR